MDFATQLGFEGVPLDDSQAMLKLALQAAHAGCWAIDLTTGWVFWSEEYFLLLGQDPQTFTPNYESWLNLVHPEDRERVDRDFREAVERRREISIELRIVRPDGEDRWIRGRGHIFTDEEGRARRVIGMSLDVTERKRADEILRASEERFAKAFDASPVSLTITSLKTGRLLAVNETFVRVTGYSREEAVGRMTLDLGLRAEPEDRAAELAMIASRGHLRDWEYRFRARDGAELIGILSAEQLEIGGEPCALTVIQDITERKRAETALRAREQRLQAMFQQAAVGIVVVDLQGLLLEVNDRMCQIVGRGREELLTLTCADLTHPDDWACNRVMIEEVAAGRRGEFIIEKRYGRPDGSWVWVSVTVSPLLDAAGRPERLLAVVQDIDARRRAEESLRESEERFRTLADNIPQLAWMARADGHIFWYNRRWYEYTGTTPESQEGWGWQSVHHPDALPRVVERWRRSLADGEPFDMTFPLRGADGVYRPFLTRVMPVKDGQGRVVRWFGTNTDITERLAAEEALREADRRKDEFLAMLAHELRNPLAPIRNAVGVLNRIGSPEPQAQQMRDLIERQMDHLTRLVDDLLDVSRITQGKIELRKEPVPAATVVARAVESARPFIEARRHHLTVALPEEPILIEGDVVRLAQAVSNLLHNAAKYTDEGGRIWLEGERGEGGLLLRVRDNGIGIRAKDLPHVFDLFAQADRSLDRSQGGLGIGLTLVERLVELHGGRVEARSGGPGKGSEFIVWLPTASDTAVEPNPFAVNGHARTSSRACCRVLVVDDNVDSAESMRLVLQLEGHEVETAYDGAAAIAEARRFRPQAVLLDIGLPGMNGYDVARALRREPELEGTALVALTGYGRVEDRAQARAAGFDHHLTKPVDHDKVLSILQSLPG